MIDNTFPIFPNNVVELVAIPMQAIDSDLSVFKRPLRNTDPQQSIGVFAQAWDPVLDSLEMMGVDNSSPQRPTLQTYTLGVQAFVKDGDEERGLAVHSFLANSVRSVLYSHPALKVALGGLKVGFEDGRTEVLQRWGIRTARYFNNEIDSINLYLSTLEFWVETETRGEQ